MYFVQIMFNSLLSGTFSYFGSATFLKLTQLHLLIGVYAWHTMTNNIASMIFMLAIGSRVCQ